MAAVSALGTRQVISPRGDDDHQEVAFTASEHWLERAHLQEDHMQDKLQRGHGQLDRWHSAAHAKAYDDDFDLYAFARATTQFVALLINVRFSVAATSFSLSLFAVLLSLRKHHQSMGGMRNMHDAEADDRLAIYPFKLSPEGLSWSHASVLFPNCDDTTTVFELECRNFRIHHILEQDVQAHSRYIRIRMETV